MLSPETLEWLRHTARRGQSYSLAHLDHVERMDALCESLVAAMKRIAALECRFVHGAPLFTGPLPADAAWTEREGREVFTARPASCPAAEAGEPSGSDHVADLSNMVPAAPSAPAAAAAPVATDDELRRIWNETFGVSETFRAMYNLGRAHGTPPAVVEALQEAEKVVASLATWSWAPSASDPASAALPAIRAALQLLGQSAPGAAPEPEPEPEPEARPEVVGFIPDEDAAPAGGLPPGWRAVAAAPVVEVEACLVERIAQSHMQCSPEIAKAAIREVAAWLDRRGNRGSANELRAQCAISKEERGANG